MSRNLLTGEFKCMESPEELKSDIGKLAKEAGKGYLLEVDISYHNNLHDLHKDLPLKSEKMKVNGVQKLVLNLCDKKKYVIHIAALSQVLKHELAYDKVCRAIETKQSTWLAPYIEFNTQLRTRAKNDFKKDFFKLMNNSVFGKTMENIRKHRDINLVMNEEVYLKSLLKPNFKSGTVFSENLIGL